MPHSSPSVLCISVFSHIKQVQKKTARSSSRRAVMVLSLSLFAVVAPSFAQGINLVQSTGTSNDAAASSISQSFSSNNLARDLIVVVVSWGDNTAPTISATDTRRNFYVLATSGYNKSNRQGLAILYASNILPGTNTVTVNFGNADHYRRIIISEYSGIAAASPLDATAKRQATATMASNGVTSAMGTTTTGGDLIFGAVMDDSGSFGTITAGTGFTRRAVLNNMDRATEDMLQTTAGPIAATFTFSLTDHYLAQMAAFRPAAVAPDTSGTGQFSLACTPTTLAPGATSICSITTTQPAPSGARAFSLSSSSTSLTVPASVTVSAGSSLASFSATAGTVASNQTITVTATSDAYTNKTSSATITATVGPPPISVSVAPSATSVHVTQTAPFTATVQNDSQNKGVLWGLSGNGCTGNTCGTLTNITPLSVTFTAPASAPNPPSVLLSATSIADGTKSASATIAITTPPPPISVSIIPSSASVQSLTSKTFTASLQNDTLNKGVAWNLSGSGCSGSSCGTLTVSSSTSVIYNAPAAAPAPDTVVLTATSVADATKSSAATITVTAAPQPISVSVNPSLASVTLSQASSFSASVLNDAANNGVTWSLSGAGCSGTTCGTLSSITTTSVTYTAPATALAPATVTLTATSVTDASKAASAAITVTAAQQAGAPMLVQRTSDSNTQSGSPNSYTLRLPNGTQQGNCIIVGLQFAHGYGVTSISVTDDKNDSYNIVVSQPGNNDGRQVVNAAYALNVASGAREITIAFIGGMPTHIAATAFEYSNIATSNALDASTTNSGSGSSITAGNFTTTAANDLLWQYAIQDTSSSTVTTWTAGPSPWALRTADDLDDQAVQDQFQPSAGGSTPTMTMSPSDTWNTVAIALKPASAGSSAPAGIRVVGIQHYAIPASFGSNPITIQFPCSGNLIVAVWLGIGGYDISRITDNSSNSYSSTGPAVAFGTSGEAQIFHADNVVCSSNLQLQVSTTGSNTSGGSELVLYDISGAAASPFDAQGTATGNQTSSGNVSTASVTPSTSNGLVIAMLTVESNTITGVSPGLFDAGTTLPAIGISPVDQNGGLAHNYNTDTSPELFVWTASGGAVVNWASIAVAFKAR